MTGISPTRVIGGRYVVLGELGRGRTGMVWRAQDRVTRRQVAVKELHVSAGVSSEERRLFRDRLLRAARAAGRIDARGIVTVHDVVTDDDVDHVVTELVEVPTLAEEVATGGPLRECAAVSLARQLAEAVHAIHDAGVVHGGITPGTVLLGPGPRVRLADLGVSEVADDLVVASEPDFLAPEVADGGPVTRESDVWSLGATVFHAVHGGPPGRRAARAGAGGPLAGVLDGMLQRAPQARLTARQVAALLEPETRPRPRERAGRRWWPLALVVLGGVVVGGAGGYVLARAGAPDVTTLAHGVGGDVQIAAPIDGACLRGGLGAGPLGDDDRVSCADPHELEVLGSLDPFDGRDVPAPGRDELARYAAAACTAVFDTLVTTPDGVEIVALVPSAAAFATGADPGRREVHCLLTSDGGGPLVGSRISGEHE
jgi:hypothetical protein